MARTPQNQREPSVKGRILRAGTEGLTCSGGFAPRLPTGREACPPRSPSRGSQEAPCGPPPWCSRARSGELLHGWRACWVGSLVGRSTDSECRLECAWSVGAPIAASATPSDRSAPTRAPNAAKEPALGRQTRHSGHLGGECVPLRRRNAAVEARRGPAAVRTRCTFATTGPYEGARYDPHPGNTAGHRAVEPQNHREPSVKGQILRAGAEGLTGSGVFAPRLPTGRGACPPRSPSRGWPGTPCAPSPWWRRARSC